MWEETGKYMQNWTGCNRLSEHETVTLIDKRDNNSYTVSKLKDGKCWMVDNLRLGDDKLDNRTISSSDSDIDSGTFTVPNSTTNGLADSSENYNIAYLYVDSSTYQQNGVIGGFYNWKAATAGTGNSSMTDQEAENSICPKGWRLPTGGPGGEIEIMTKKYGSGTDRATAIALQNTPAPNFGQFGYYNSGLTSRGSRGLWWSSIAYSSVTRAYCLDVSATAVYPTFNCAKASAHNIRCIDNK